MSTEPIAIVGMACHYPDATDAGQLWQTVLGRRRAFRRLPEQRLGAGYRGTPDEADTTYVTHAGLLRDWSFDRQRFGIPGPLYRSADLSHWLALQTAAEVLADAGLSGPDLDRAGVDRDLVGVVLGNSLTGEFSRAATVRARLPFLRDASALAMRRSGIEPDRVTATLGELEQLVGDAFAAPNDETLAGALSNTIAGRICNHFDFHGTGYTVDGACSSSLLAVMTACRALRDQELDLAIAGGVDLSLDPLELVGFARVGALAVDEMRVYDANPTGFLPGEGCGMVALMRASHADRLGLRTYATIVGWGTSSDGSGGLTRPEVSGQTRALARAYRMAGVDPAAVGLIEGHGTGTAVGDQVEMRVLRQVLDRAGTPAAFGSIKANIGHTKAAAGVAGLIKAALATYHRILPPTTGCEEPHELLRGPGVPVRILAEPQPWTDPEPVAGVSSMGFGGINTHLVLRGAGSGVPLPAPAVARWAAPVPEYDIVLLHGRDRADLADRLDLLAAQADRLSVAELHDLAATCHHTGDHGPARAALVAARPDQLAAAARRARELLAEPVAVGIDERAGCAVGVGAPARVGLLFPGQAAPVRARLPYWLDRPGVPVVPDGVELRDGDAATQVAQPAIVRQSLAGLAWLHALGCRPVAAVGHSLGEITALVHAGALDPVDGLRLAAVRGRLMADYGRPGTGMANLATDADRVAALLDGTGVVVSGRNGAHQTTVAGPVPRVREVLRRAAAAGVSGVELAVSHGFHSPAMEPVADPLRFALSGFTFGEPRATVVSTTTGAPLTPATDLAALLVEQLTRPVDFLAAVRDLAGRCDLLVETGPGTILTRLAPDCGVPLPAVSLDCGGGQRQHAMATAVLAAAGAADLGPYFAGRGYRLMAAGQPVELLTNPCETLPVDEVADVRPPARAVAPVPAAAPVAEAAAPVTTDGEPLTVLREHLARTLELPVAAIRPTADLLGDLHLSSLQVVHTVSEVARMLGRDVKLTPVLLAGATVAQAAEVLASADRPAASVAAPDAPPEPPPGPRVFAHRLVEHRTPDRPAPAVAWRVVAPDGHWLAERLAAPDDVPATGLAVALPEVDPGVPSDHLAGPVAELLARIGRERPERLLVTHHGHPAAAAVARSAVAEYGCHATVVELPADARPDDLPALVADGYQELRIGPDGSRHRVETSVRATGEGGDAPLRPGDVLVVTGGVDGITAEAASVLAERSGCRLLVLGRTAADAPAVVAGLDRLRRRAPATYASCDVTDPDQVRRTLAAAAADGVVAGIVHGAGINEPRPMSAVDAASLHRVLRPKVDGLRHLLDAAGPDLRLVVGFGSIIGRCGLTGQPEYCVANDWMRLLVERWAAAHPDRRALVLEWSVWSDLGMGVRLGAVDSLARRGVAPILPADGCAVLLDLVGDPGAPVTVTVTSRFPAMPTFATATVEVPALRFAESRRDLLPGVEVVLENSLSLGADPYLDDHRLDGTAVFPAVLGLEAMAQSARSLRGPRPVWSVCDAEFAAPITVPERAERALRCSAVGAATNPDAVTVTLRDDSDGFAADRFRGTVDPLPPAAPPDAEVGPAPAGAAPHPFYGDLLFHSGRFRRLVGYDRLSAFEVRAWVGADQAGRWFSAFHGDELLLGDPGLHDASIHVLLACVPHRRALPVGVDRFTVWHRPDGPVLVTAVERRHTADDYVYDVEARDAAGRAVAAWEGLRLRAVGRPRPGPLPVAAVGPYLARRLIECGVADTVDLSSAPSDADVPGVLGAVAGGPVGLEWRWATDEVPATGDAPAGEGEGWQHQLARDVADKADEPFAQALGRVTSAWAALRQLTGGTHDQPLRVDIVVDPGTVVLRANGTQVLTARMSLVGADRPAIAAVAVAVEGR
ncbi:SDR family NAD(P)-dependent oxidoreductase [Polymorphospora sp. NPDC050346]|uniref:SDR family NAD(P)-dependent oxidoreductase n=1 Tax=Polymorphospora sp. NPDC050346 TaxID=3155780 RepID=UPI0033ECFC1C